MTPFCRDFQFGFAVPVAGLRAVGFAIIWLLPNLVGDLNAQEKWPTTGMEGRYQITVPGAPLEARPVDRKEKVIVRIASTYPHGSQTRYDLRYIGLVPGQYDLRDYLTRSDRSSIESLSRMPVTILGLLPDKHNGWLLEEQSRMTAFWSHYRGIMISILIIWVILLVPLIKMSAARAQAAAIEPPKVQTLADRLRPLITQAAHGNLSKNGQAQLERMLIQHWQNRLGLQTEEPRHLLLRLREHEEAGKLLHTLEEWLHRPPGSKRVNVEKALQPYLDNPNEEQKDPTIQAEIITGDPQDPNTSRK